MRSVNCFTKVSVGAHNSQSQQGLRLRASRAPFTQKAIKFTEYTMTKIGSVKRESIIELLASR